MLKGRELAAFRRQLLGWFRQFQRDLPWRRTKDPYRIWLSEIMLQQTRVAAAIPYYERFLQRFPDVHSLATAPEDEVLRLWENRRTTMLLVTHDIDEAIYMSDRILIMTQAPGRIDREIHIDLARPRDRTSDSFLRFRSEILEHLHFAGKAPVLSA